MKHILSSLLLISHFASAQSSSSSTISTEELASIAAAYQSSTSNAFATAYHIDGATLGFLLDNGASSIRVSNGLTNTGQKVFILSPIGGNASVANHYYIQYETNLCPPACDASIVPAIKIDGALAVKYMNNFTNSKQYELVKSFVLLKETVNSIGSGRNLKVHNVIQSGRRIAVTASGYVSNIFLEQPSTLCPPACD